MTQSGVILAPDGRPARRPDLAKEVAAPSLASVRQPWMLDAIAPGLTPDHLQAVLDAANQGDTRELMALAGEIEERQIRYGDCLGVRKRAVQGVEITVESASDAAADVGVADELRGIVASGSIGDAVAGALDGLGKGFGAVEILWDRSGPRWTPRDYRWRDPRYFRWDRENPFLLRLLTDESPADGVPLEFGKWIVHVPPLRSGIPARGGLARRVATLYVIASWALADWSGWLEVFGRPTRLGRYGADAKEEQVATLLRALSGLGSDNAAAIPESMSVELLEASRSSSTDAYERLMRWVDEQIAVAVLGQSATTQGTPGRLGSDKAQADVRADILRADCMDLGRTLTRDLARPYVHYNHGPGVSVPRIALRPRDPEDTTALAQVLRMLVPLGLNVEASVVRDRLGWPDPPKDAEVLEAPARPGPASGRSLAAEGSGRRESLLAELEGQALDGWERDMDPLLAPVRELAARASSREEFVAGLADALGAMDDSELRRALASATFAARGLGDARDEF